MNRLRRPTDTAALVAFRITFGLVVAFACVRYALTGWIEEVLVQPDFFFKFAGFEWVPVPGPDGLYALMIGLAVCGLCISLGFLYRLAAVSFFVGFTWLQLMDVTNYLNHYYLVVLLAGYVALLPLNRAFSLDRRLGWVKPAETLPAWMLYLLRFQLAVVYVHAGLAKVQPDWLMHHQPLGIWLSSRADTPLIGGLLAQPWAPAFMSWAGCLYDTTIAFFLLWPRTRLLAYGAVLFFHGMTQALFDIGMFPTIMITSTLVFFPADWPRRVWRRLKGGAAQATPVVASMKPAPLGAFGRLGAATLVVWCLFQAVFPLRSHAYPGDVLWGELGMRFSWKVLLREKHGSVTYHVTRADTGRTWQVNPTRYLELRQYSEMSGQPDLIIQLAHHIKEDFRRRGRGEVEVRVEALVSLNGRAPALLMRPDLDLTRLPDTWPPAWLTPPPEGPPLVRPTPSPPAQAVSLLPPRPGP